MTIVSAREFTQEGSVTHVAASSMSFLLDTDYGAIHHLIHGNAEAVA